MKYEFNRILLVIMEDGERYVYTVPTERDPQETYDRIIAEGEIDGTKIKSNYFFPQTIYTSYDYQNFWDEETESIDQKSIAIDFKIGEFRKQRTSFFTKLDLEFMKSLEEDCKDCIAHVTKIKNFFREAPDLIEKYCEENLSPEEIIKFNAFNNIFDITIIYGGSGYTKPPVVTISPPDEEETSGFQAKAVATIKDGKILDVIMLQVGSGYKNIPKITVSSPDEEDGEYAILTAHAPENDIFTIRST
jgi:hypothetical protein